MMYILMSETCWTHKKWNKISSDIKLVFYSSTITIMHGPINVGFLNALVNIMAEIYVVFPVQRNASVRLFAFWCFVSVVFLGTAISSSCSYWIFVNWKEGLLTFVIRRKSGVPRTVTFKSSSSNVTPQLPVYATFDARLMLRGFPCRCVFEKFHDCNLKEGWLPGAEMFEHWREEVVGEIRNCVLRWIII